MSFLGWIRVAAFPTLTQRGWYGSGSATAAATQGQQANSTIQNSRASHTGKVSRPVRTISEHGQSLQTAIQMPDPGRTFVLFAVKGPRRTLELAQIDTSENVRTVFSLQVSKCNTGFFVDD